MRRGESHCLTTADQLLNQPSADILGRIDPSLIGNVRLTNGNRPVWVPDTPLEYTCDPTHASSPLKTPSTPCSSHPTSPPPARTPGPMRWCFWILGAPPFVPFIRGQLHSLMRRVTSRHSCIHPPTKAILTESLQPDPDKTVARAASSVCTSDATTPMLPSCWFSRWTRLEIWTPR